jgi:uncharacterized protein (TIGR03066 family)
MIRVSLVLSLLLLSACTVSAFEDKIDGKLLIGKWEPEKLPPGLKVVMEFAKDNKLKVDVEIQGKQEKVEGTYKLENDQFTMTMSKDGQERTQKLKVVRLNDKELVLKEESKNEEQVLKRLP